MRCVSLPVNLSQGEVHPYRGTLSFRACSLLFYRVLRLYSRVTILRGTQKVEDDGHADLACPQKKFTTFPAKGLASNESAVSRRRYNNVRVENRQKEE
jgi:hypothetical protein